MVTVAMTVLPCACGDRLTRVLLGGRAPGPTPPRRVVPPRPPTRPGGGSASRKAGGAWCPRRPATLRRWGGRDLGRGARKDGPAPRGGGLRPGRGCGHAKSAADRRPGTTGSAHRRLRARRYHTGRIFRRPDGGIRSPGSCRAHHPAASRRSSRLPGPGRLFSGLMAVLSLDHLRAVGTARSSAKCTSRRPGCSGAGRRCPRDRRVTAEIVT